jgi:hypothetical protein
MSDSQVSPSVLEQPSQSGQAERANESQDLGNTGGQPSDKGQVAQVDENIRKLQSTYDRKMAEERKTFQQQQQYAQQQIQAMQQRLAQMEEAAAPDDYSRLELRLKREIEEKQQYAAAYQQTLQERQAETARQEALREIADEFGVPIKDIEEATDYKSAVKLAVKAQLERDKRKTEQDDDKSRRNMPDIGSGAPRTASSEWERQYAEARERRDTPAMMRLLQDREK